MGGGKGGTKFPVTDYLMSMQFGICKGPIDQINQIYIKEKPVWCGYMTQPGNIYVNQPDLFGGDKGEGGPMGVIECYFGTADQVMSNTVAVRADLTSGTMPGYRGIANVFFRGYDLSEATLKPGTESVQDVGGGTLKFIELTLGETGLFPGLFDPENTEGIEGGGGFKWTSNNPYIPSTWVSATRVPKGLSTDFALIYPYGPDFVQENDVTVSITGSTFLTLAQLGVTAEQVDAGIITLYSRIEGAFAYTEGSGGGPAPGFIQISHTFYQDDGGAPGTQIGSSRVDGPGSTTGGGIGTISGLLPVGTRHVKIDPDLFASFPIFTNVSSSHVDLIQYPSHNGGWCGTDGSLSVLPNANGAHMVYEALNDPDWGMGTPRAGFDLDSFMYSAETFYNEKFGLTIFWSEQMEIEKYVSEILDHVQAALFIDPTTGLWRMVPYRADYVVEDLLVLDPSNCIATDRQRKAYGEIVNEVIVSWTNPENEKEETVTFQEPGSISTQGLVSTTRNYYGIRTIELANAVGARDIRGASYPLFSCNIVAHRDLKNIYPGAVVVLNWPEDGIVGMVLRVGKVDYGQPGDKYVRFPATEDIYGLEAGQYVSVQKTGWVNPDTPQTPMDQTAFMTAPLSLFLRSGNSISDLSDGDYPIVPVGILANRSGSNKVETFDVMGTGLKPNGETEAVTIGTMAPTPTATLTAAMLAEIKTLLSAREVARFCGFDGPSSGTFLNIGSGDTASEIVMLDSYDSTTKMWTLARGMYDTVPKAWPAGTRVWFLTDALLPLDPANQSDGVEASYRLLPMSGGRRLPLNSAPVLTFTPSDRPYDPIRPANVTVTASGAGALMTPYPVVVQNPGAETHATLVPTLWTSSQTKCETSINFFSPFYWVDPHSGSRFFFFGGTVGNAAYMEQTLSIPAGFQGYVDAGGRSLSVRYWRGAMRPDQDWAQVTVDFYDGSDALISTFVGDQEFAETQTWKERKLVIAIPPLSRSYKLRFDVQNTVGTRTEYVIDDISVSFTDGDFPVLAYVGTEIPTTLTFNWSNRNRLMEDTVAPRWTEGNVTPEAGQTTTIRCRERFSRSIEYEVTGITGTTYALDVSTLVAYRFYDIEVLAVRDGFESIQPFTQQLELQRLGYDSNYGYDYGENDGA